MPRSTILPVLAMLVAAPALRAAEPVALAVDPGKVENRIDEKVYGHFLEHIYHSVNGGLWGDLVWDRSFEGAGGGVAWKVEGDCLVQEGAASDVRLLFGDPSWSDYELTLEARKTGGEEGFQVLLRALDKKQFYWANLGGWGNKGHALERGIKGEDRWRGVTKRHDGPIETGRWYKIRARCDGPRIQVWLDGTRVIDYTDDGKGPSRGRAGIGTWDTQAQFRGIKVVSLDGKTLHEGLPPVPGASRGVAPGWRPFGAGTVSVATEGALNGAKCRKIESDGPEACLVQEPLCLRAGEAVRGSLWARGEAPGGLVVRFAEGGKTLAEQVLPAPGAEWREYPVELKPEAGSDQASLQVAVKGKGSAWIDQVSLMPEPWRQAGGLRPDLLKAIAGLRPPVIRWPGGCYASPYRWKDGIGPQHKRGPHPRQMWDDKEVNSFGTDEFVAMCRKVGAEPLIVVNIGTPQWNKDVIGNDFLKEVLDWIEYCNGPADSTWGKVRAANGHPEPYGVKYWEIDNETWGMGAETYAEWVNRFAPAMRKADPAIRLAACGSAGYGDGGNGLAWNRVLIERCADRIDYLSIHHYENPGRYADGPRAYEAFFRRTAELIAGSKNPKLKLYVSEWNAQSTDWRTGLYCGGILNAFERCGDVLEIGGPALFLRHVSASAWDNAFVNFDHRTWFPAPNYVVMKLWRDHYAPERVALAGDPGALNVVATRSADGRALHLKAVNPSDQAVAVKLVVGEAFPVGTTAMRVVAPGSLDARNALDRPDAVRAEAGEAKAEGQVVAFTLPPLSAAVVTIGKR
jgi:alpha-L-arabinofuranosidase